MREIKVKAWHKTEERWIDLNGLNIWFDAHPDKGGVYAVCEQGVLKEIPIQDVDLVFFTGFYDKYGKEIYDGYLIEVNNDSDDDVVRIKCEIKWQTGQWIAYDILGGGTWTRQLYYQSERIEIIGNIYEHSHLLK